MIEGKLRVINNMVAVSRDGVSQAVSCVILGEYSSEAQAGRGSGEVWLYQSPTYLVVRLFTGQTSLP